MYDTDSPAPSRRGAIDYRTIFNERGEAYHRAMLAYPHARRAEFEAIVRLAAPCPGQVLCDAPSGGGYLRRYLPDTIGELISLETSEAFHRLGERSSGGRSLLTRLEAIDLPAASVDCVVSLAGLHHLPNRSAFFREAARILRPGGSFCVADVAAGTRVARFLNEFVDRCNSSGHTGVFLGDDAPLEVGAAGFRIDTHCCLDYAWSFDDARAMVRFVTMLFGLDRARPDEVRAGIGDYLGYDDTAQGCRMHWGLRFLRGVR